MDISKQNNISANSLLSSYN
jgi:hypothetical protein